MLTIEQVRKKGTRFPISNVEVRYGVGNRYDDCNSDVFYTIRQTYGHVITNGGKEYIRVDAIGYEGNNFINVSLDELIRIGMVEGKEKIIGYKFKSEEFRSAVLKINNNDALGSRFADNLVAEGWEFVNGCVICENLNDLGVLDIWCDEVYEPDGLPEIEGYKAKIEGDIVHYGCQSFSKTDIKTLSDICDRNNIQKITFDGSTTYTVSITQINKVLKLIS